MTKFYEVAYEGEESSFYVVFGTSVGLFFQGQMHRTLMTLKDCEELVRCGHAVAHS